MPREAGPVAPGDHPAESGTPGQPRLIRVAAGILRDSRGRCLLSRRPEGTHLAGTWEFPGGKLQADETPSQALARELAEELGIAALASVPFLTLTHVYPERTVQLHFREVPDWQGQPKPLEGQELEWVHPAGLADREMPAADRPVIRALELDSRYAITPDPETLGGTDGLVSHWRGLLEAGYRLLQLRAHSLDPDRLGRLAETCGRLARERGARWLLNGPAKLARETGADGVHLTSAALTRAARRPVPEEMLVIASCHERAELDRAGALGADLVTLSPVLPTATHPERATLGWDAFEQLCQSSPLPVLGLGGLGPDDLARCRQSGAFGVAGIRAFAP